MYSYITALFYEKRPFRSGRNVEEQRLSGMLPFNGQQSSETVESQPGCTMVVGSPTTNVYGIGESCYMSTNALELDI